jgi:hypothetical protein
MMITHHLTRNLAYKKIAFFSLAFQLFCLFDNSLRAEWNPIHLPHQYIVSAQENFFDNIYSAQIPAVPLTWELTEECHTYQSPSIHWKSNLFPDVKGLSFKGLVFKIPELKGQGDRLNSFAVFFHNRECYKDGAEYGWVFHEDTLPKGAFYVCEKCNLDGQKWAAWPLEKGQTSSFEVLEGDAVAVENALQNSGVYRYWNIQINENGDFKLELVDPATYKKVSVTLKKPSWLSNCYNLSGYITVVAKKLGEITLSTPPLMHVDYVKLWQ